MYKYCWSPKHKKVTNGNGYYVEGNPLLCPTCGDPWVDPKMYTPEAIVDANQHAIESKRKPHLNQNGEIILEWMYFTDDELIDVVERDRHRDVIKAALAAQLLELRSHMRALGDYEFQPYTMLSSAWVAMHFSNVVKWVDYWSRGIPMYWRNIDVRPK